MNERWNPRLGSTSDCRITLRAPDQVALHLIAALLDEERHLDPCFDPFRKDRDAKTVREPDDRANDGQ
jgi:hypothetical protein